MSLLTIMMLVCLLGAAAIYLIPTDKIETIKKVALAISLFVMVLGIYLIVGFDLANTSLQFSESRSWISAFGINYSVGVDGISAVLILMSVILVPIVLLATWNEADSGRWSSKSFYILVLILELFMIGVFAATDLFLFYVFFEAMLIPVYFMIAGFGNGERAAAAVKFLLYSLFGGLLMLASIIGTYVIAGNQIGKTFDIEKLSTLQIDQTTQNFLFLGFFLAFAIKAPLWPFHTWLPDAARSATTGTSV